METPHAGFILAAYAVAALVLVGMALAVTLDGRRQRAAIERLSARQEPRDGERQGEDGDDGR